MRFNRRAVFVTVLGITLSAAAYPADVQTPSVPVTPVRYTGTLTSFSNDSVSLKDTEGKPVTIAMTSGWTVVSARALDISALKVGEFVASANVNIDSGSGRSTELRVLEPGYRPEENTHPLGQPNTSMTHGTIAKVDRDAAGVKLVVTYPSGSRSLAVSKEIKITGYDVHARGDLSAGALVTVITRVGPDGVSRAARVLLGD